MYVFCRYLIILFSWGEFSVKVFRLHPSIFFFLAVRVKLLFGLDSIFVFVFIPVCVHACVFILFYFILSSQKKFSTQVFKLPTMLCILLDLSSTSNSDFASVGQQWPLVEQK